MTSALSREHALAHFLRLFVPSLIALALVLTLSPAANGVEATADSGSTTSTFKELRFGDSGPRVQFVRKVLEVGDGSYFTKKTKRSVKRFQDRKDIVVTGVVNERTWKALERTWARVIEQRKSRQKAYEKIVQVAKSKFGSPYSYGSAGPSAFDCSGYTLYVYKKATGMNLPHRATSQYRMGKKISKSQARKGDLVFFHSGGSIYHVGIYAGKGYTFHSSRPGTPVGKAKIWTSNVWYGRLLTS